MRSPILAASTLAICVSTMAQQGAPSPAVIHGPKVELKGKIVRVRASPGQGTPVLEIESGGKLTTVLLGSMRYLIENDFDPKAGDEVEVEGFERGDEIVARTVVLGAGKTLRLRDDEGRPLWQRGRHGRRRSQEYNETEGPKP